MGALLKLGIRKEGNGNGMVGSDFVEEENQNNLMADGKGQTNLLVATLIATVTFTAAFTVPGGYHQNLGKDEGLAVFGKRASFRAFTIANTLAFGLSITSILVHFFTSLRGGGAAFRETAVGRSYKCTLYALATLLVAFISGTFTVVPDSLGITVAIFLSFPFSLGVSWFMCKVMELLGRCIKVLQLFIVE